MPKYRNTTGVDIVVGSLRFPARSDLETSSYVEGALPSGLVLVSDLPKFDIALLDASYSKSATNEFTVTVPANPETSEYAFDFYVESGEFKIYMDYDDLTLYYTTPVGVTVAEGERYTRKFFTRAIDKIRIHCIVTGKIYVRIFKVA